MNEMTSSWWSPAPAASSAATSSRDLLRAGLPTCPRRRHQAARRVVPASSPRSRTVELDLRRAGRLRRRAADGAADVYNLAADMGGMGFIENNKARLHALGADQHAHAAWPRATHGVERFFFASSACVYAADKQTDADVVAAARKRTPTRRCRRTATAGRSCSASACAGTSARTSASTTRVARYHNVYGPHGTYDGGREKAPAAICRKVIEAKLSRQPRDRDLGRRRADPQLHVHRRLPQRHAELIMDSDIVEPLNLGSDRAGHDQPAGRHRRGDRRRQAASAATTSTRPRACAAATATTR